MHSKSTLCFNFSVIYLSPDLLSWSPSPMIVSHHWLLRFEPGELWILLMSPSMSTDLEESGLVMDEDGRFLLSVLLWMFKTDTRWSTLPLSHACSPRLEIFLISASWSNVISPACSLLSNHVSYRESFSPLYLFSGFCFLTLTLLNSSPAQGLMTHDFVARCHCPC